MNSVEPSQEWLLREAESERDKTVFISAGVREGMSISGKSATCGSEFKDDFPSVKSLIVKHGKSKLIDYINSLEI